MVLGEISPGDIRAGFDKAQHQFPAGGIQVIFELGFFASTISAMPAAASLLALFQASPVLFASRKTQSVISFMVTDSLLTIPSLTSVAAELFLFMFLKNFMSFFALI